MKRYKLIINFLLGFIFISSIIALGVIGEMVHNHWYLYNNLYVDMLQTTQDADIIRDIKEFYSQTLCLTFSIIFSVLSSIASAATLILLNFKVWKERSNNIDKNS